MKQFLLLSFCVFLSFTSGNSQTTTNTKLAVKNAKITASATIKKNRETKLLRKKHAKFLANSPYSKTLSMTEDQRIAACLPPNAYYESLHELTMNPATGETEERNIFEVQKKLTSDRSTGRTPGDGSDNNWIERGPSNVGGRTRVLLFDPNDPTNKKVYAGAATGGLWVKTDITTSDPWVKATGIPENLNVSCITVDPNNPLIWYMGTGEQYTSGDAVGKGVYKTTNGGTTWVNIPVNYSGTTFASTTPSSLFLGGVFFIQDIMAWNNAGKTEIFIGVGSSTYRSASTTQYLGAEQAGLYKSTNGGATWTRNQDANMVAANKDGKNYYVIPNDLEKDAAGNLWFSTTSIFSGVGGGKIYKSSNGITWTLKHSLANAKRTEIEPSSTNPNKFYLLYHSTLVAKATSVIAVTNDAFATAPSVITQPDDVDTGVPHIDFTNSQAHYDLMLECDPTNDAILYIGGVSLYRSVNSGGIWKQISKWSNNGLLSTLPCSLVHSDQHVMTFRPGAANEAVFGNDGGVFYSPDLSVAETKDIISSRNESYNVTQFYSIGVRPVNGVLKGDYIIAGAQDNGSQLLANISLGSPGASSKTQGGDGAYSFYDQDGSDDYMITNGTFNGAVNSRNGTTGATIKEITENKDKSGSFSCPMTLDSSLNILYSDFTIGTAYAIKRYTNVASSVLATVETVLQNALLTKTPTALEVSKYTAATTTMLVGCKDGKLLFVTNADGVTPIWKDITGSGFVGSISDLEFGATENDIFVTFHNYGVVSVWYSANKGVSWQNKEGNFPDIPVKCILQNPLKFAEVIIGTDLGVWYTNNFNAASPTWNQSYNGMSEVKVTDLQVRNDNAVYAATYGRGVFSGVFTGLVLAINENEFDKSGIKVYPTINNGSISILSSKYFGSTKLNLFDMAGKNVYSNTIRLDNSEQKINLGNLSSGNYILKIAGDDFEDTKRLIINN